MFSQSYCIYQAHTHTDRRTLRHKHTYEAKHKDLVIKILSPLDVCGDLIERLFGVDDSAAQLPAVRVQQALQKVVVLLQRY